MSFVEAMQKETTKGMPGTWKIGKQASAVDEETRSQSPWCSQMRGESCAMNILKQQRQFTGKTSNGDSILNTLSESCRATAGRSVIGPIHGEAAPRPKKGTYGSNP
jgi:hypothetical protein